MKRNSIITFLAFLLLLCALSTSAFAIDESEVESAIAASGKDAVAGNVFIWFLCAISFLKVSQKVDSFMASLGINVGTPRQPEPPLLVEGTGSSVLRSVPPEMQPPQVPQEIPPDSAALLAARCSDQA